MFQLVESRWRGGPSKMRERERQNRHGKRWIFFAVRGLVKARWSSRFQPGPEKGRRKKKEVF